MAIDSSIYNALGRGVKTVRDWQVEDEQRAGAAQSRELNALTLQSARETAAENALARRRTGQVQASLMALGPQAKPEQVAGVYSQYGMTDQADKVLISASTRAKSSSEVLNAGLQRGREMLQFVNTPQAAQRWWQAQYADPVVGPYLQQLGPLEEQFDDIPTDPAQFGAWRQAASMLPEKFQELIAKQARDKAEADARKARDEREAANSDLVLDPVTGKWVINQPLNAAKVQRAQAGATVTMGSPVAGVDPATGQSVFFQPGNRPGVAPQILPGVAPAPKAKPNGASMSPTLQKELIESDEMVAGAQSVKSALAEALRLNDKAYSGVQALNLAKVRSNLPGQSAGADATIQFDNIIREGALTGMKAIFGGNPTEGERAILLEIQASTEKTPAQRKAILERAMKAADRRAAINAGKAKAIREGTYLTDGPPQQPDDTAPAASPTRPGTTGGWSMQRVD